MGHTNPTTEAAMAALERVIGRLQRENKELAEQLVAVKTEAADSMLKRKELIHKLAAAEAENERLRFFFEDLSKKHADCEEKALFTEADLDQARAVLLLGVFGCIEAESIAIAIACGRMETEKQLAAAEVVVSAAIAYRARWNDSKSHGVHAAFLELMQAITEYEAAKSGGV